MSGKPGDTVDGVENANGAGAAPKRGCMARFGAHCKRFWWLYLIIFIIVVLVVILPIVYVAYPKLAQKSVDESTLTVTEMEISEPRPDGLHLRVTQSIGSSSPHHPWLDAFVAELTLMGAAAPFANLNVPRVQAQDGAVSKIDQDLVFPDLGAFTEYSKAVMHNENVEFNVYGETGLKQGALPKTTVTYDKQVTMKGLNGLKGFDVTDFHIITPAEDSGVNMRGNVFIPNPSVLTLHMGNLTLDLSIDGEPIGTSNLNDVVIVPGDNNIKMASQVNQSYVIGLITDKDSPYGDGVVPIQITGNSSVYNDEKIPYFSEALASNELTVKLNLLEAL